MGIGKLIVQEAHGPARVDGRWHRQGFRPVSPRALVRIDPQVQPWLAVDPIPPLVIPAIALDVA